MKMGMREGRGMMRGRRGWIWAREKEEEMRREGRGWTSGNCHNGKKKGKYVQMGGKEKFRVEREEGVGKWGWAQRRIG